MPSIKLISLFTYEQQDLGALAMDIENSFHVRVTATGKVYDPAFAYNSERGQYFSTAILDRLAGIDTSAAPNPLLGERIKAPLSINTERCRGINCDNGNKILGVTDVDLFIPILTYVFGEAELGGRVGVVSTCRLKLAGDTEEDSSRLAFNRLLKEAKHELGHTFGLIHCRNINCVLYPSTNPQGVDQKGRDFCIPCRKLLNQNIAKLLNN